MKISKGVYKYEHRNTTFEIDNIQKGVWAIFYNCDKIDESIFNEYKDADRTHTAKRIAIDKAIQYIDETKQR